MGQFQQKDRNLQGATQMQDQFFREVEIQFLIHELKDPISIIETGLRTLLERQEKFGSLTSKQENTLKRTLRNTKKARSLLIICLRLVAPSPDALFALAFNLLNPRFKR